MKKKCPDDDDDDDEGEGESYAHKFVSGANEDEYDDSNEEEFEMGDVN